MADHKGSKATTTMEDLTEVDKKELEKELEEDMVERQRKKLACFQKTHHNFIKKVDTTAASGTKVDYPLSPKDLVQLVDVSVASKYGTDLTQFT
jgi:hypothetical protein